MARKYATGKNALGECDRCGFVYKLQKLQAQVINRKKSGLRVCPSCMDIDHEQLQLGRFPVYDPQALRDPRPERGLEDSRTLTGTYDPATHAVT